MLVNTMLKGNDFEVTPERLGVIRHFLGWLRKNGQVHRDKIAMIVSGSVRWPAADPAGSRSHHARQHLLALRTEALDRGCRTGMPQRTGQDRRNLAFESSDR